MLDINLIRKEPEKVKRGIAAKGADPKLVDKFLKLDEEWRALTTEIDGLRAEQKKLGAKKKVKEATKVKEKIKAKEERLVEAEKEREAILLQIPNVPLPGVPVGKSEKDNKVIHEVGDRKKFSFPPKDYLTLAHALDLIDTERAAKVSGSRFGYLLGDAVRLEFALGQLVFETLTNQETLEKIIKANKLNLLTTPFIPIIPPVLINERSIMGMGYLSWIKEEAYHLPKDNLYLVGTAEQSIGPMHTGETFDGKNLPRRYVGFSASFRREAGSYGKDTRGILRVHQFDKFEMFSFAKAGQSEDEHRLFLALEEYFVRQLELPYRVVEMCTADLGEPVAAKYDIEAWMPGQPSTSSGPETAGAYRETHSTSNTTDYQARRLNVKYKDVSGTHFVHTVNGTAFAIGRTLIAIFENYQTKDGKIEVPKVLQTYVGKKIIG